MKSAYEYKYMKENHYLGILFFGGERGRCCICGKKIPDESKSVWWMSDYIHQWWACSAEHQKLFDLEEDTIFGLLKSINPSKKEWSYGDILDIEDVIIELRESLLANAS